jgi:ATP-dependent DNA ligase
MHPTANIELIESREIETVEDAIRVGEEYLAMGCEGAIIKHGDMLWGDERSKLAIKIKGERECDLKIVGIQPGEGKYTGMIGAYICESACGKLRVNVGGGLSDDDRAANPDDVIDKILGVLYNEKIKSKSKKAGEPEYSLFLPRVHPDKRIRIDKDVADTLDNIE